MKRLAIFSALLLAAVWFIASIFPQNGDHGVTQADIKACRTKPSPDCLLDIGVAWVVGQIGTGNPSTYLTHLLWSGRLEDAVAVIRRSAEQDGIPLDEAIERAHRITTRFRFIEYIRAHNDLDAALANFPSATADDLLYAARYLLGRKSLGPSLSMEIETASEAQKELVAALAARVLAWNLAVPQRAQDFQLNNVAELRAALGDREGAIEALRELSARDLPSHMRLVAGMSIEVVRVVGPDTVLAIADPSTRHFPMLLQHAGSAEQDPARAAKHFTRAFELYASRSTWPAFGMMLRVVRAAADRGLAQETRAFADQMVELAEELANAPLRVFHNLDAAEALLLAGAGPEDVSRQLDVAVSLFPADSAEVVAVGIVSGPMRWEASGLADEARGRVSAISAENGDHQTALSMLRQLQEPLAQWIYLTDRDLPVAILDILHKGAWRLLQPDDAAYVTGQLTRMVIAHERKVSQERWALRTVRDLAADPEAMEAHSGQVATAVAVVAFDQEDGAARANGTRSARTSCTRSRGRLSAHPDRPHDGGSSNLSARHTYYSRHSKCRSGNHFWSGQFGLEAVA